MEKIGGFYGWPRTDDILPYPFEDITKTLDPPNPVGTGGQYSFCWTTPLKLLCYISRSSDADTRYTLSTTLAVCKRTL